MGLKINRERFFPGEIYIFLFWYFLWILKEAFFFWSSYAHHPVYNPLFLLLYLSFLSAIIKATPVVLSYTVCVRFIRVPTIWVAVLFAIFCADFYLSMSRAESINLTSRRGGFVLYDGGEITSFGILILMLNPTIFICFYAFYKAVRGWKLKKENPAL
ncbi:hypothetical protein A11S_259 [Micavibrio aeruginosavorus EPB]|uniref:Uncharacterized protein n=1 Tax=Micavibrio aeruginosavorus EPB TaxID=349215 RepID=M4VF37_9BACT|nr:hypothetical protein A11S_259 [Micavibrio aeruginosavorus EPB]